MVLMVLIIGHRLVFQCFPSIFLVIPEGDRDAYERAFYSNSNQ